MARWVCPHRWYWRTSRLCTGWVSLLRARRMLMSQLPQLQQGIRGQPLSPIPSRMRLQRCQALNTSYRISRLSLVLRPAPSWSSLPVVAPRPESWDVRKNLRATHAHDWMVPGPLYMWATTSPSAGQHLPSEHGHWNVPVQSPMHGHLIARYILKTIITVFTLSRKKKTWGNSRGINERYFRMWMNIIVSCYT